MAKIRLLDDFDVCLAAGQSVVLQQDGRLRCRRTTCCVDTRLVLPQDHLLRCHRTIFCVATRDSVLRCHTRQCVVLRQVNALVSM